MGNHDRLNLSKMGNHDRLKRLRMRRPSKLIVTLFAFLTFSHEVLYWLHHPLLKYVMLLQLGLASHDSWHASRLGCVAESAGK